MSTAAADLPRALLQAEGLTVAWDEVTAVQDFRLRVHAGEFVGLMGQPGCGKSTALLALVGLVRGGGRITAGQVLFDGQDLLRLPASQLAAIRGARIGLITHGCGREIRRRYSKSADEVSVFCHTRKLPYKEGATCGSCHIRKVRTEAEQARELPHIRVTIARAEHISVRSARVEIER